MDIIADLKAFLQKKLEVDLSAVSEDTPLFDEGIIDSMGSLLLLSHVEKTYGISFAPRELVENPFDSMNEMAALIAAKREAR